MTVPKVCHASGWNTYYEWPGELMLAPRVHFITDVVEACAWWRKHGKGAWDDLAMHDWRSEPIFIDVGGTIFINSPEEGHS